jgi:hypothetical protein
MADQLRRCRGRSSSEKLSSTADQTARVAGLLLLSVLAGSACVSARGPAAPAPDLPARVVSGEQWRAEPPRGYAADAGRRNLPVGGSYRFRDLEVAVVAMRLASAAQATDVVELRLVRAARGGDAAAVEERSANEGEAFVWDG